MEHYVTPFIKSNSILSLTNFYTNIWHHIIPTAIVRLGIAMSRDTFDFGESLIA